MEEYCVLFYKEESTYNEMIDFMFSDIEKYKDMFEYTEKINNFLLKKILKKLKLWDSFGYLVNSKTKLELFISNLCTKYNKIIILTLNTSFLTAQLSLSTFERIKIKYPQCVWILYYIDSKNKMQSLNANKLVKINFFNFVYSYEKNNSGAIYFPTPYSKMELGTNINSTDIYFCGADKGRKEQIKNIANFFVIKSVSYKMDLTGFKNFSVVGDVNIMEKEYYRYSFLLNRMSGCKCILDIVQDNQEGLSLRPYEAVVYNKKLLTNNPSIFEFEYYNENFMKYFEDISQIDVDWLIDDCSVDYHYEGEFSPRYLIKDIFKRCEIEECFDESM